MIASLEHKSYRLFGIKKTQELKSGDLLAATVKTKFAVFTYETIKNIKPRCHTRFIAVLLPEGHVGG